MLVTRPEPDAADSAMRLEKLGLTALKCPLLVRNVIAVDLPAPARFSGLALTSANALYALAELRALRPYLGLKVYAVGKKTASTARKLGFAHVETAEGTLADLIAYIGAAAPGTSLFYPGARHQSGDLAAALAAFGIKVHVAHLYEMTPITELPRTVHDRLAAAEIAAALFYSTRTAQTFVQLAGEQGLCEGATQPAMLCLSAKVAAPLVKAGFTRIDLANDPGEHAMMALALAFARGQNRS